MNAKFKIGDEVQSITDPSRIGTVVEICEVHAGVQWYRVNFGPLGRPKVAELDLRPYFPDSSPYESLLKGNIDGYPEFQRLITYQRLLRDHPLRNNIYAFNASRTRFYPYQFKPLLKFLDSAKSRLLIADEVGLGKTIEAGLILTELRARQTVQRVLVVCPANLTAKWRLELKNRFDEGFRILNKGDFLDFLRDYEEFPNSTTLNGIISLETIRNRTVLDQLEAITPSFDMVIVDEAHHMRNFGRKQRKAGLLLSSGADAMLFLTATPIHLGNENLYSLLNILDEEEFPDYFTVKQRFDQNEPVVKAQICVGHIPPKVEEARRFVISSASAEWLKSKPEYDELLYKLEQLRNSFEDKERLRTLILEGQRLLSDLNLLGHIFTRTRKKDVHGVRPVRRAFSICIELTQMEKEFYDTVTDYVRSESEKRSQSPMIQAWILQTPQRRMSSSIPAMVGYHQNKFGLGVEDLTEDMELIDESADEDGVNSLNGDPESKLKAILQKWPDNAHDSKYEHFIEILRELRNEEGKLKIMVFAFFKDTLKYLQTRLRNDGFNALIISGDVDPPDRPAVVDKFRNEPDYEILLSSKVGSEGLDFQFCNILFNYDLPWNPMEVEQRIGRLDRIGQEAPVLRIYNFYLKDTIEERIIDRLYKRIGIFERSIGELEMILGDILRTIERDILSKKLTPEVEETLLEEKERAILARMEAIERLEKNAAQFIGTDQYFEEEVQMIKDRRRYITGEQLRRFIVDFIKSHCPRTRLEYDSKKNLGKIFLDDEFRKLLTRFGFSGSVTFHPDGLPITFDSQTAFDNPRVDFINVLHPITRCISKFYNEIEGIHSNAHHVVLKTKRLAAGRYLYFIYRLRVRAARGKNTIEMVIINHDFEKACSNEDAEAILGEMVEKGEDYKGADLVIDNDTIQKASEAANGIFHNRLSQIRTDVSRNNDAFVERRLESLRTSYEKKINMKEEQLQRAKNKQSEERYIKMLKGTIRRLRAELEEKERKLEMQRNVEVEYDEISAGILEVAN